MSEKICKTCQEWLKNKYGELYYTTPFSHCHHPEPRCRWCDEWRKLNVIYHGTAFWKTLNYLVKYGSDHPVEECPVCGRKFEREVE
jgi:hypothetical protein